MISTLLTATFFTFLISNYFYFEYERYNQRTSSNRILSLCYKNSIPIHSGYCCFSFLLIYIFLISLRNFIGQFEIAEIINIFLFFILTYYLLLEFAEYDLYQFSIIDINPPIQPLIHKHFDIFSPGVISCSISSILLVLEFNHIISLRPINFTITYMLLGFGFIHIILCLLCAKKP